MHREIFFDITFYIFVKWRKRVQKKFMNGKILILCINEVLAHLKLRWTVSAQIIFGKHSGYVVIHSHLNLIYFLAKEYILPWSNNRQTFWREKGKFSSSILFFNVWNVATFSICEIVLTESYLDIVRIAKSNQHISNPDSEVNRCIGLYISDRLRHQRCSKNEVFH